MKSRFNRFVLAAMILLILGSSGCAGWHQLPPPPEGTGGSYRGLNENTILR
jgi:hypothetical protein